MPFQRRDGSQVGPCHPLTIIGPSADLGPASPSTFMTWGSGNERPSSSITALGPSYILPQVVRPVHSRFRRVGGSRLVVAAGANGSVGRYITDTSKRSIRPGGSTAPLGRPDPWRTYIGESHQLLSRWRRRVDWQVGLSLPDRHHAGEWVAQSRWLEQ